MEYRFLGCPVSFYMVLTYLYSLNNPPYSCTITVILTPAHMETGRCVGRRNGRSDGTFMGNDMRLGLLCRGLW